MELGILSLAQGFTWEVSIVGISLTTFILTNILTKPYKHRTDWLLCLWLFLLNVPLLHSALNHLNLATPILFHYTNPTLNLLNGPILYLYVRLLISREKSTIKRSDLLHFIPFGLFYVLFLTMSHPDQMIPQPDKLNSSVGPVAGQGIPSLLDPLLVHFGLINVLFFFGYSIVTIYILNKHQKNITGIFSQKDNQITLKWIYALPSTVAMLVILNVAFESFLKSDIVIEPITLHMLSFLTFIVLLCFFGIKQKPVFQTKCLDSDKKENVTEDISIASNSTNENNETTSNNNLSNEFIKQIIEEMQFYMQSEKPYTDPDFSVYMLSNALNIPRRSLSLVLNTGLSKNFYQYVNEFRIEEVKVQLEHQDNKSTIIDIAFQAGFKSKSSFNSLFKQYCHVTPSQYRKMIKQQTS